MKLFSYFILFSFLAGQVGAKPFPLNFNYINKAQQYISEQGQLSSKGPIFLSIHPDLNIKGSLYNHVEVSDENTQTYVKEIFGALIAGSLYIMNQRKDLFFEASSSKELKPKDSFWAFLLASIAIPHHESNLIHFRSTTPENCSSFKNSMDWVHRLIDPTQQGLINFLEATYYDKRVPVFPDCRYMSNLSHINQLIQVNTDTGLMQINLRAHPNMAQPDALFNMYRHIEYALSERLDDYIRVLDSSSRSYLNYLASSKKAKLVFTPSAEDLKSGSYSESSYLCDLFSSPFPKGKKSNYIYQLVRSTWAMHNMGNPWIKSFCRPQIGIDERDHNFLLQSLNPILGLDTVKEPGGTYYMSRYENYLSMDKSSLEYLAFKEIVDNIKAAYGVPGKKATSPKHILKLAENFKPKFNHSTLSYEMNLNLTPVPYEGEYYLKEKSLSLFLAPELSYDNQSFCGKIHRGNEHMPLSLSGKTKRIELEEITPPLLPVSELWAPINIPSLRDFHIEWAQNQNREECMRAKKLWASIEIGNDNLLGKTGQTQVGEYYVQLNSDVKSYLQVRSTYDVLPKTELVRWEKSENRPVKVVEEYHSPYNRDYPHWLRIEINSKESKYGWVAADFVERVSHSPSKPEK